MVEIYYPYSKCEKMVELYDRCAFVPNCLFGKVFNPFPHDKILDQTKFKAFADDKLNVTKRIISVFDRVEKIVGIGEIACTSNFSFSHNLFKKLLSQTHLNLCGNGLSFLFIHNTQLLTNYL